VGIQKLVCLGELLASAVVAMSLQRALAVDVVDVEESGGIVAGPAEPYCAAALLALDAVVAVVLYMLDLPYYRPARWVLGLVSSSPEVCMTCVDPGIVLVGDLVGGCFVVLVVQEMV